MHRETLKILFPLEGSSQFHYVRSVVQALSRRGHRVQILFGKGMSREELLPIEQFKHTFSHVDWSPAFCRKDFWSKILFASRNVLSYRRYIVFEDRPLFYKSRLEGYLPFWLKPFVKRLNSDWMFKPVWVETALRFVERIIPPDKTIVAHIREFNPDIVLVPSANLISSTPDIEYLKAARAMGIPTFLVVMTWDSLENKGITNILPDRFLVWNEIKSEIAKREHHVPEEMIRTVGASQFDEWFLPREPRTTRREFCARYGLRETDPIILYLCSSANITKDERWLVSRVRAALDASGSASVRNVQIVVRPHPLNAKYYHDFTLPNVVFGSRTGALPTTAEAFQVFYDELYHAAATIGVNTSAMLEALIAGKPGITILEEQYRNSQTQIPYFRQLLESGALYAARVSEEIPGILNNLLEGRDVLAEQRRSFVASYIRPRGLDRNVGEVIAEEIEQVASNTI